MYQMKIVAAALLITGWTVVGASAAGSGSSVSVGVSTNGTSSAVAGTLAGSNSLAASTSTIGGVSGSTGATASMGGALVNQTLVGSGHVTLSITVNGQTMTQSYVWSSF